MFRQIQDKNRRELKSRLQQMKEQVSDSNVPFPFLDLPPEIIIYTLFKLEPKYLIMLFTVNNAVMSSATDNSLWKDAFYKKFDESYHFICAQNQDQNQNDYFNFYKMASELNQFNIKYCVSETQRNLYELIFTIIRGNTGKTTAMLGGRPEDFSQLSRRDHKALLCAAIAYGRTEVIELLVNVGANLNEEGDLGYHSILPGDGKKHGYNIIASTWLELAAFSGNMASVQYFHDRSKNKLEEPRKIDRLVRAAISSGNPDVLTFIKNKYKLNFAVYRSNGTHSHWIHLAAYVGNYEIFKSIYFIAKFERLSYPVLRDMRRSDPFIHPAIDSQNIEIVRFLIKYFLTAKGDTYLSLIQMPDQINRLHAYAIESRCHNVADFLIDEFHAVPDLNLLKQAIDDSSDSNTEYLEYVIKYSCCNINALITPSQTPLAYARSRRKTAAVLCLITNGALSFASDNVKRNQALINKLRKKIIDRNNRNYKEQINERANLYVFINYIKRNISLPFNEIIANILRINDAGTAPNIILLQLLSEDLIKIFTLRQMIMPLAADGQEQNSDLSLSMTTMPIYLQALLAIFAGDTKKTAQILDGQSERLSREKYDFLLCAAISFGHLEIIDLLVKLDVALMNKRDLGCHALPTQNNRESYPVVTRAWLELAASTGNINSLKYLHYLFQNEVATAEQINALVKAAIGSGNPSIFKFVAANYSLEVPLSVDSSINKTWLHLAALAGNDEIFKSIYLIIKFNLPDRFIPINSLMHTAIGSQNIKIIKFLMSKVISEEEKIDDLFGSHISDWINKLHVYAILIKCHAIADYLIEERHAVTNTELLQLAVDIREDSAAIIRSNQALIADLNKRLKVLLNNENNTSNKEGKSYYLLDLINQIERHISLPFAQIIANKEIFIQLNVPNNPGKPQRLWSKSPYSEEVGIIIKHLEINNDGELVSRLKKWLDAKQENNYVYPLHKNNKKN